MSIFDLTQEILALEEILDEALGEVPNEDFLGYLIEAEDALESKVEAYCKLIKECEAKAKARSEEAERIARLARTDQRKADFLKSTLKEAMELLGRDGVETLSFRIKICKNGGKQSMSIEDEEAVLGLFGEVQMVMTRQSKENLRVALAAGDGRLDMHDGEKKKTIARLEERGTHLRIK